MASRLVYKSASWLMNDTGKVENQRRPTRQSVDPGAIPEIV